MPHRNRRPARPAGVPRAGRRGDARAPPGEGAAGVSDERHELAVIGAGPAGMAAAITAAELGLDTVLFDEQVGPGGQSYRNIEELDRDGSIRLLGEDYRGGVDLARELRAGRVS